MKIHLIDGTYELFRAFYGAPPQTDLEGREVGAALGLARSLLSLIRDARATHLACAFDHVIESFRNQLFEGYKTGEGVDPKLLAQFELAERAAFACGLTVWPMVEFEADDALATAASRWSEDPRVERIVICSPDKDLAQCVRDGKVVCLNRRSGVVLDAAGVEEKYGVAPQSIPDWLALVGDSADGFPGVPGWGGKSAAVVLQRYKHLEEIPDYGFDWDVQVRGAERLATNLRKSRPESFLYRKLATLRTDVPLAEKLSDLEWKGVREEQLRDLSRQWKQEALMENLPGR